MISQPVEFAIKLKVEVQIKPCLPAALILKSSL
jgi:hypothetical protein